MGHEVNFLQPNEEGTMRRGFRLFLLWFVLLFIGLPTTFNGILLLCATDGESIPLAMPVVMVCIGLLITISSIRALYFILNKKACLRRLAKKFENMPKPPPMEIPDDMDKWTNEELAEETVTMFACADDGYEKALYDEFARRGAKVETVKAVLDWLSDRQDRADT